MPRLSTDAAPALIAPLPQHRFDTVALATWLQDRVPEGIAGLVVQQFQGGMSNPTYLLTLPSGTRMVLRKKPPGRLLPKAHAIDREYRILAALAPTVVPTPRVIAYCDDPGVIGAEFFVMEYLEGRIIADRAMAPVPRPDRPALAYALIDTLADLHLLDWRACGLDGFGRPEGYLARQTARWSGQYEAAKSALPADFDYADMDWLRDWMIRHSAVAEESAITHGDFRLGNAVVHPAAPRIIGLLDWELSTIGHPVSDLAYLCLAYRLPPEVLGGQGLVAAGLPSEQAMLARYCERTGRSTITDWPVFLAFNCLRSAAIIQGVAARAAQGTASSASADPAREGLRARRIAQCGADIARRHEQGEPA